MNTLPEPFTGMCVCMCALFYTFRWVAHEKTDSMDLYTRALKTSDLTLCPVGQNAESYRIYEAMAMGSVPVIEDVDPTRNCRSHVESDDLLPGRLATLRGRSSSAIQGPHRFLKSLRAPVIFVKSWKELPALLEKERAMTQEAISERRARIVRWYKGLLETLNKSFLAGLNDMSGIG